MSGLHLLNLLGGLILVLGTILVAARLLRRASGLGGGPETRLSLVGRIPLGSDRGIALVRIDGRELAVGYGTDGVRLLLDLEDSRAADSRPNEQGQGSGPPRPLAPTGGPNGTRGASPAYGPGRPPLRLEVSRGDADTGDEDGSAGGGGASRIPGFAILRRQLSRVGWSMFLLLMALGTLAGSPDDLRARGVGPAYTATRQAVSPGQGPGVSRGADSGPGDVGDDANPGVGGTLPDFSLQVGNGDEPLQLSGPVGAVLFIGFLTLVPTLLLLTTSFTRILVVLHLLKQALGTQTAPPAHLLAALALLLTAFVMGPTLQEVNRTALRPWMNGELDEAALLDRASEPFRDFMLRSTRESHVARFVEMTPEPPPRSVEEVPTVVLASAFVTSEMKTAFQMGFVLFLPFVVIDLVVASVLMSMGMFMLPPVMVSLPFKLLLFVLVDGWTLVVGGLVQSF